MGNVSPDGKFKILENRRDDDSYMYSYSSFSWSVVAVATGDELATFSGSCDQDSSGSRTSGVEEVEFSEKGDAVVAKHYDGKIERLELPIEVKIVEDGKAIVLAYKNGRTEQRERSRAMFFTKYGQPYEADKLVNPPRDDPSRVAEAGPGEARKEKKKA